MEWSLLLNGTSILVEWTMVLSEVNRRSRQEPDPAGPALVGERTFCTRALARTTSKKPRSMLEAVGRGEYSDQSRWGKLKSPMTQTRRPFANREKDSIQLQF